MQVSNLNSQILNEHYIIIALLLVIIYLYLSSNASDQLSNCPHCKKEIEPFLKCGWGQYSCWGGSRCCWR